MRGRVFAWPPSGDCVYACVCTSIGCNRGTRRDPPRLVWRENGPRLVSPARAHYPEAVRALCCQFRLSALLLLGTHTLREMCGLRTINSFLSNWKTLFKEWPLIDLRREKELSHRGDLKNAFWFDVEHFSAKMKPIKKALCFLYTSGVVGEENVFMTTGNEGLNCCFIPQGEST